MSLTIIKRDPSPVTPDGLLNTLGYGPTQDCAGVAAFIEAATEWVEAKICQKVRKTEALWTFRKRGTPPLPVERVRSLKVSGGCDHCNPCDDHTAACKAPCGASYRLHYDVEVCDSQLALTAICLAAEAMATGEGYDRAEKMLAPLMPSKCAQIAKKFGGLAVRQVS